MKGNFEGENKEVGADQEPQKPGRHPLLEQPTLWSSQD